MTISSEYIITDYAPEHAPELVAMWRASFEKALDIVDPHPIAEQIRYLEGTVVRENDVIVVIDAITSAIVAFMASTPDKISQLYVHVDHQGRGIGTMLLDRAKNSSHGGLRLFTFDRNGGAQRFYERHGFAIVARGVEPEWELEDIEYEWTA